MGSATDNIESILCDGHRVSCRLNQMYCSVVITVSVFYWQNGFEVIQQHSAAMVLLVERPYTMAVCCYSSCVKPVFNWPETRSSRKSNNEINFQFSGDLPMKCSVSCLPFSDSGNKETACSTTYWSVSVVTL